MIDRATSNPAFLDADLAALNSARVATNAPGRYPGGKNGAGIWQRLISLMPPHREYIEAFLGSGAILRRKRPARARNVGIDADAGIIARHVAGGDHEGFEFIRSDARVWLQQRRDWSGDELIYCDPPYLGSARLWPRRDIYAHELKGDDEHAALLQILAAIPAMIMISGYPSPLYDERLAGWRRIEYQAQTRGGPKPEVVWMNYPAPTALHDYRVVASFEIK